MLASQIALFARPSPLAGFLGEGAAHDPVYFDPPPNPVDPALLSLAPSTGGNRDVWARQVLEKAWDMVFPGGPAPTLQELQAVQSVAGLESGYGSWGNHPRCGNNGVGSNNMGSVQCCKPDADGNCPANTFLCGDYDSVSGKDYRVCFKSYPTPEAGMASVVSNMTKGRPLTWAAMKTGDSHAISAAMLREKYYGGFHHNDPEANIKDHETALLRWATKIALHNNEQLVLCHGGCGSVAPPGTTSQSSSGPSVAAVALIVAALAGGGYFMAKAIGR